NSARFLEKSTVSVNDALDYLLRQARVRDWNSIVSDCHSVIFDFDNTPLRDKVFVESN
ncbi:unnamed protein product, partial [Amoebophrya sp. A120]